MKEILIKDFFETKKKDFALSMITEPKTLDNKISSPQLNRPGLALAGYFERFAADRVQIIGETEISYLQSLKESIYYERMRELFTNAIPLIVITKGLSFPTKIEQLANESNIAILSSRLSTINLIRTLGKYLNDYYAPEKTIHATLIDVFGLGIILTGKSGIGKSECALDLVSRGHSLISDDSVTIKLIDDLLVGQPSRDFGHFMEIRGVGLVNVEKMFGIQRVKQTKDIDLQIELMPWQENMDYERIGLTSNYVEHLGVHIPIIYLPVSPGKSVSVIVEVAAMNMILKKYGYDAAEDYAKKLQEEIKRKTRLRNAITEQGIDNFPG